jgi:E3 ubiquitin-protein ligase SHPRH
LKVFIYEGWSKLQVPITEYDVLIERAKRRSRGRAKSTASSDKSGRGKRKITGKKRKRKAADSDDEDDEDYMDVDKATPSAASANMDDEEEILDWCSYINTFDVCITTYNTLRQDLSVARAPPVRPRREDVVYSNMERARSPLVMCEWYRVIMDEVQMVGGGKIE